MRELEFLPQWYPQIWRRRRLVILQAWGTLVLLGGLALGMVMVRHNTRNAQAHLDGLDRDLSQSRDDLRKLDEWLELEKEWRLKDRVIERLGLHVEATRLVSALEQAMPPRAALVDLSLTQSASPAAPANPLLGINHPAAAPDRRLKVRLKGVAPSDEDLAVFLHRLSQVPFFEHVAMNYAKERRESARLMREFEVTFSINLNGPVGG